jgi:hypothetical protein
MIIEGVRAHLLKMHTISVKRRVVFELRGTVLHEAIDLVPLQDGRRFETFEYDASSVSLVTTSS